MDDILAAFQLIGIVFVLTAVISIGVAGVIQLTFTTIRRLHPPAAAAPDGAGRASGPGA